MAFIPPGPVIKLVKQNGPKMIEFTMKNWPLIVSTATTAAATGKKVMDKQKQRKEEKQQNEIIPYRKLRYEEYIREIIPSLELCKRSELTKYKLEIENILQQLEQDKENGLLKKSKLNKQLKEWNELHIQVSSSLMLNDYHGLLSIYHKPDFYFDYFEDYEAITERLKMLKEKGDAEEIKTFIQRYTNQSEEQILADFVLE